MSADNATEAVPGFDPAGRHDDPGRDHLLPTNVDSADQASTSKPAYTFVHVNDLPAHILVDMFPHLKVVVDGDCGSVWGERHLPEHPCQFPHVMILDASEDDLEELRRHELGYVADRTAEWGEDEVVWRWKEDSWCNARECTCDHRSLYVTSGERRKS